MMSDALRHLIGLQRGHLLPWVPVCLGTGIGLFFALRWEPGPATFALVLGVALSAFVGARRLPETVGPAALGLALVAAGFTLAGLRAHLVAAPVLEYRYYGPIEGRVVAVDRSISDKPRVTLDRVILLRVAPDRTPARVRVSLHGAQIFADPLPGQTVAVTGHLTPPPGPVEPHGFDFQRMAWFDRIGAVGYTRTPLVLLAPPARAEPLAALNRFRLRLSAAVQAALPGQVGAFAAAVTTGDRAGLSRETLDAMRDTNLAHLLAISGLHVGLLTGFIFTALRAGIALVPRLALRVPAKKWAAALALLASAVYLALSGGNVSTQRAFIMAAVMLVAVMLDRRALTLRSVALAAIIVLAWQPESLMSPGFQMSFAATAALVWVFGQMRQLPHRPPRWSAGLVALVVSSAVAGLATAPFAAAHFNQGSNYGLLANLVSVPVMGAVVIPAAVLAACLAPFGLAQLGLWAMGLGIGWILNVAQVVAGFEHAVRYIVQPGPMVMPLLTFGALVVMLWQGRWRWAGLLPLMVAGALWGVSARPVLLVADNGALAGVMTQQGRALSRARGHGFIAQSWLENDGRDRDRETAFARSAPFAAPQGGPGLRFPVAAAEVAVLFSATPDEMRDACARTSVVVSNRDPEEPAGEACVLLGPSALSASGGIAVVLRNGRPQVTTVRGVHGVRLWNAPGVRAAARAHDWPGLRRAAPRRADAASAVAPKRAEGTGRRDTADPDNGIAGDVSAASGPGQTAPLAASAAERINPIAEPPPHEWLWAFEPRRRADRSGRPNGQSRMTGPRDITTDVERALAGEAPVRTAAAPNGR
ncbi:competence protein [Meridianimarinicoccus roseus]|uniref:Competence protein n=1 Tax=Meridianimarinicoccus roseus TaxID=2072018 RepID=A0A2V2LIQ2_9RHOB|nr:ComEC/Rec2 family competence protein [Meridianimarinicoccus roseus]PWR03027.1 competence protein [Meridianimarinicoccus roseus]